MGKRKDSAGLAIYRWLHGGARGPEFFLLHPGGPYWARKDDGAWTIPKGEIEDGEDKLTAARRETREETGFDLEGPFLRLPPVRQPSRKVIHPWAVEASKLDPTAIKCTTFEMEWPPQSGHLVAFPECDRAAWFGADEAMVKILRGQWPILERLLARLRAPAKTSLRSITTPLRKPAA